MVYDRGLPKKEREDSQLWLFKLRILYKFRYLYVIHFAT